MSDCENEKKKRGGKAFRPLHLVSDVGGLAQFQDANLVNPWGIVIEPGTNLLWVADNGTGKVTAYDSSGVPLLTGAIAIPSRTLGSPGTPTGLLLVTHTPPLDCLARSKRNKAHRLPLFPLTPEDTPTLDGGRMKRHCAATSKAVSSRLIAVTEDGLICAYHPSMCAQDGFARVVASFPGQVFTGVAQLGEFLYVSDFHSGRVGRYNRNFELVSQFSDYPVVAEGYGAYNVVTIHHWLFVAYALQNENKTESVPKRGAGYISVFDKKGVLLTRFASGGCLNAPWAITLVPPKHTASSSSSDSHGSTTTSTTCCAFSDSHRPGPMPVPSQWCRGQTILIGNFGDGRIHSFDLDTGQLQCALKDHADRVISVHGLWGLAFLQPRSHRRLLYFTAGIDEEQHGLLGSLASSSAKDKGKGRDKGED